MAIEFRCRKCGRLLRTPDETAGRQAQCPECHELTTVPAVSSAAPVTPGESPVGSGAQPSGAEVNPYQSPAAYSNELATSPFGPTGSIAPQQIDFNDMFSRTWEIFKREWGMCLVALLIVWAISIPVQIGLGIASAIIEHTAKDQAISVVFNIFSNIVSSLVGIWLGIGQAIYFLKTARGQRAEFSDIFAGGPFFITILLASILFGLIYVAGLLLCVVPGVIFMLMFSQFYYLIIDRNMGVIESLETSKQIMQGNKLTLFLIALVSSIGAGVFILCTCGLGLFAAAPFLALLHPIIYLAITGQPTADRGYPRP